MAEPLGFVGLGNIGGPMAGTILRKLKALTVFDVDPTRVRTLVEAGAEQASSLRDLAARSRVILLSLPTSHEVEVVLLGDDGIGKAAARGTLIVDLTSGSPNGTELLVAAVLCDCGGWEDPSLQCEAGYQHAECARHGWLLSCLR